MRKHLQEKHGSIYFPTVKRLGLKHASDHTPREQNNEPFTLEAWIDKLIRWLVVDDQVNSFLLPFSRISMPVVHKCC